MILGREAGREKHFENSLMPPSPPPNPLMVTLKKSSQTISSFRPEEMINGLVKSCYVTNRPKFGVLGAKKYTDLKKVHYWSSGGSDC